MKKPALVKSPDEVPEEIEFDNNCFVPDLDQRYHPYGHFHKVRKIIRSGMFFPSLLTGHSGNGKTKMVEQAAATCFLPDEYFLEETEDDRKAQIIEEFANKKAPIGREMIRVNFTTETDENDLIGGFRLVNGNTDFHEGPIVTGLRRGAIVLLDEFDAGATNKILCLQSVMEGNGVFIKSTGELVHPARGFQVFATSNTKGRGSSDGRYAGTQMMNAAFLDRFSACMYQAYPPADIEETILRLHFVSCHWGNKTDAELDAIPEEEKQKELRLISKLCEWANAIRENFDNGSTTEVITTRSLISIIQGYMIFDDPRDAIEMALERFPEDVKHAHLDIFNALTDEDFTRTH